jgi:hypothetical protein
MPRQACGRLQLLSSGDTTIGVAQRYTTDGPQWLASLDGGETWKTPLYPPVGGTKAIVLPSSLADQQAILVGGSVGGVWAFGPGAQPAAGRVACTVQVTGGFGKVWESDARSRNLLGCPIEAEHAVRVRERRYTEAGRATVAYWTEDELGSWFKLDEPERRYSLTTLAKESNPWPAEPVAVHDATIQWFEGGAMLWPGATDGRILVLATSALTWKELKE